MENITEYQLKITGSASFGHPLNAEERLKITDGEIELYSTEKRDNQDGTFKVVYKGKFVSSVDIEQTGFKIVSRNKSKKSQRNRMRLQELQQELEARGEIIEMDEEKFYNWFMDGVYHKAYAVFKLIQDDSSDVF